MWKEIFSICCLFTPMVFSYKSTGPALLVGDKTFWDSRGNGSVYYNDYLAKVVYRYDFGTDEVYQLNIGDGHIGFFAPVENQPNQFIVGLDNVATIFEWDGHSPSATRQSDLFTVASNLDLNGLLVSPENDFYIGNLASTNCAEPLNLSINEYLRNKQFTEAGSGLMSTIGLTLVDNTVYYIDGCKETLSAFDWNPSNGHLSNQRDVLEFDLPSDVKPGGLAADTLGHLYTSAFGGGYIMKIVPSIPAIVKTIPVPTPYASAPTFGGPNNDILFVATASLSIDFNTGTAGQPLPPPAGYLFQIPMDVQGVPTVLPRI